MNASTDRIAVIQARLPYTDRRALSQAWFSAFHLASGGEPPEPAHRAQVGSASSTCPLLLRGSAGESEHLTGAWPTQVRHSQASGVAMGEVSQRGRVHWLRPSPSLKPQGRANVTHMRFTLGIASARIALHVRREGEKLIVIALCGAQHAELVHKTLAEVAARMRSHGARVDTTVRAVGVRA